MAALGRVENPVGRAIGGGGAAEEVAFGGREDDIQRIEDLVNKTLALVETGLAQFSSENPADLTERSVIMIGDTGVGKSTLINLLAGVSLRAVYDATTGRSSIDAPKELDGFIIGHKLQSETFVPRKWVKDGVMYWDCPGFLDNRGGAQEIANATCIQKIFATSRQVKILIMIADSDIMTDPRVIKLRSFVQLLDELFLGSVDSIQHSISLIVSRSPKNRKVVHVQNIIRRVIEELNIEGPPKLLLESLCANPISIFQKPDEGVAGVIDTTSTRTEILGNIDRIPYAENIKVNICISEHGKQIAIASYDILAMYIRKNIDFFLKAFKESVEKASTLSKEMDKNAREKAQKKLTLILQQIEAITSVEYDLDQVGTMITKCVAIAKDCGKQLSEEKLKESLKKLESMKHLEQFVDERAHIPLEIVATVRNTVIASRIMVQKSLVSITAINETERAEAARKLADEEIKKAGEEKKKAEEAKKRYHEAQAARQAAEKRMREYQKPEKTKKPKCVVQ